MNRSYQNFAGSRLLKSTFYLLHELRSFRRYSILLPFLGCASQISLSLVTIYMPKLILDSVVQNVGTALFLSRILMLGILLAALSLLNLWLHNSIEACSNTFLYTRLTMLWEEKCMNMKYENFTSGRGKLLMEKARIAICSPNFGVVQFLPRLSSVLENFVGLIVYAVLIGTLHPLIILFLLFLFGMEMWFGAWVEHKKQSQKEPMAKANRKLNYLAYRTKGMQEGKDIRIYSMHSLLRQLAGHAISDTRCLEKNVQGWQFRKQLLAAMLVLLRDGMAYAYLISRFLIPTLEMSIGAFTLYLAAIAGFGGWLTRLSEGISAFVEAGNYGTDFREFMELANEEEHSLKKLKAPISFTFQNVSFSYLVEEAGAQHEAPVIRNLNLTINAGESIAIVGVNGAGKSTLVKLLCGMLEPQSGSIFVNQIDSRSISKKAYYELFSAVFQGSGFLPISIAKNIMLNTRIQEDYNAMWDCIRMAGLEDKINSLPDGVNTNLVKRVSEHGTELSGGEEQRLLLARALYKDAPVLILDEPTAALDPIAENEIYRKYHQFTKGKTAVFISHRLASTRFCDRIILLENGSLAESGTHEELMQLNGKYAEMFRVQSQYYKAENPGGEAV